MVKRNNDYPRVRKAFFRTRTFWGICCIVVAAAIAFVGLPFIEDKLNTSTYAIVTKQDIPKGAQISGAALQLVEVPSGLFQTGYLSEMSEIDGKYAVTDLAAGDYLTAAKVAAEMPYDNYLYQLPADRVAISIDIPSFSAGVSRKLLEGDIVSIAEITQVVKEDGRLEKVAVVPPELTYVRVLAITNENGNDVDNGEREAERGDDNLNNATITFEVQPVQAMRLTVLNDQKTSHLIFICRGTDARAAALLQEQAKMIQMLPMPTDPTQEGVTP